MVEALAEAAQKVGHEGPQPAARSDASMREPCTPAQHDEQQELQTPVESTDLTVSFLKVRGLATPSRMLHAACLSCTCQETALVARTGCFAGRKDRVERVIVYCSSGVHG